MNCERANQVLYLFFDNELDEELLGPFRAHTDGCPGCSRRLKYTRRVLLLVRQCCRREAAPERLRVRILAALPHRTREQLH